MPSISVITMVGTGSANAATRSAGFGPASISSSSPSTSSWSLGRIASTRFTVNGRFTVRRIWVCSGASVLVIIGGVCCAATLRPRVMCG